MKSGPGLPAARGRPHLAQAGGTEPLPTTCRADDERPAEPVWDWPSVAGELSNGASEQEIEPRRARSLDRKFPRAQDGKGARRAERAAYPGCRVATSWWHAHPARRVVASYCLTGGTIPRPCA